MIRRKFLGAAGITGLGITGLDSLADMALAFDQAAGGVRRRWTPMSGQFLRL